MTDEDVLRRSIQESRGEVDPLLAICLSCAVPLWIEEVRRWDPAVRQTRAHEAGHVIAYGAGAAAVATGGKERNKSTAKKKRPNKGASEVFNAMAMGLAILAFCPGGVTFAGNHWEAGQ